MFVHYLVAGEKSGYLHGAGSHSLRRHVRMVREVMQCLFHPELIVTYMGT